MVITTPNTDGWLYEEYQSWELGSPNHHVVNWHASQNPAKTPEEHAAFLNDELKRMGQTRFDRMYGGLFTRLSGLVYPAFGDQKCKL